MRVVKQLMFMTVILSSLVACSNGGGMFDSKGDGVINPTKLASTDDEVQFALNEEGQLHLNRYGFYPFEFNDIASGVNNIASIEGELSGVLSLITKDSKVLYGKGAIWEEEEVEDIVKVELSDLGADLLDKKGNVYHRRDFYDLDFSDSKMYESNLIDDAKDIEYIGGHHLIVLNDGNELYQTMFYPREDEEDLEKIVAKPTKLPFKANRMEFIEEQGTLYVIAESGDLYSINVSSFYPEDEDEVQEVSFEEDDLKKIEGLKNVTKVTAFSDHHKLEGASLVVADEKLYYLYERTDIVSEIKVDEGVSVADVDASYSYIGVLAKDGTLYDVNDIGPFQDSQNLDTSLLTFTKREALDVEYADRIAFLNGQKEQDLEYVKSFVDLDNASNAEEFAEKNFNEDVRDLFIKKVDRFSYGFTDEELNSMELYEQSLMVYENIYRMDANEDYFEIIISYKPNKNGSEPELENIQILNIDEWDLEQW